jgi:hypothetical protein
VGTGRGSGSGTIVHVYDPTTIVSGDPIKFKLGTLLVLGFIRLGGRFSCMDPTRIGSTSLENANLKLIQVWLSLAAVVTTDSEPEGSHRDGRPSMALS